MTSEPASPVARIGLGTAQFGSAYGISNSLGQVPPGEARAILAQARDVGITVLDTAAAYGNAEEVLGSILPADAPFRVVTKTLPLSRGLAAVVERAHRSVALCGRRSLDTLLVHAAGDLASSDGPALWRALERLRDEGLFRRIGISAYFADDPRALAHRYRPAVMQIPVSLFDQRCIQDETLLELKRLGIEVHARSIFLQGLLLMAPADLPAKLNRAAAALAGVRARIADAGSSPLQAAIQFILDRPEIDVALVGVTRKSELDEIVSAAMSASPALDWGSCALDDPFVLTPSLW
jgi:aryl-alcohol dehydrogenase-like predicted oxidoreductase